MYEDYEMKTEVPEGMELTDFAEFLLKELEHTGIAVFETDDGPGDLKTVKQIRVIAGNVGYELLCYKNGYIQPLPSLEGAGKYALIDSMSYSNQSDSF